jgi:hypothetical protein
VGRLVQAEGYDGELSPAQWMALRYFARANPFSRNPSAFAEFQATRLGTCGTGRLLLLMDWPSTQKQIWFGNQFTDEILTDDF